MVVLEVFKVSLPDSVLWSRTCNSQFLVVVEVMVFVVFLPDMVLGIVLRSRILVVVLLVVVMVYDRACRCLVWDRPQTFLSLAVVVIKVVSQNRFQRRFLELTMSMEVPFPVNVLIMDVFKALFQDRGSRARRGAHVRGGGVQGSVPGQSSPALGHS